MKRDWIEVGDRVFLRKSIPFNGMTDTYTFEVCAFEIARNLNTDWALHSFILKVSMIEWNASHNSGDSVCNMNDSNISARHQYFKVSYQNNQLSIDSFKEKYRLTAGHDDPDIIISWKYMKIASLMFHRLIRWAKQNYPDSKFKDLFLSSVDARKYLPGARIQQHKTLGGTYQNDYDPKDKGTLAIENIKARNKLYKGLGYLFSDDDLLDGKVKGDYAKHMGEKYLCPTEAGFEILENDFLPKLIQYNSNAKKEISQLNQMLINRIDELDELGEVTSSFSYKIGSLCKAAVSLLISVITGPLRAVLFLTKFIARLILLIILRRRGPLF